MICLLIYCLPGITRAHAPRELARLGHRCAALNLTGQHTNSDVQKPIGTGQRRDARRQRRLVGTGWSNVSEQCVGRAQHRQRILCTRGWEGSLGDGGHHGDGKGGNVAWHQTPSYVDNRRWGPPRDHGEQASGVAVGVAPLRCSGGNPQKGEHAADEQEGLRSLHGVSIHARAPVVCRRCLKEWPRFSRMVR